MKFSLKVALLCLVAVVSAAPATTLNPDLHHLVTRMAKIPEGGVVCPDGNLISKAEIQYAIGRSRASQSARGYPQDHRNHKSLFPAYSQGKDSGLEEYPIILGKGDWKGGEPGLYRVIYKKGKTSGAYVGVLQHKKDMSNDFLLCKAAAAAEPSCSNPTTKRSVVRDLWERATKKKGKGKGKSDAGAACPLPAKKPTDKTPTTPEPKTPKKTKSKKTKAKKTKKTKSKKTKKTKAKNTKKTKKTKKTKNTKGRKKGGKL